MKLLIILLVVLVGVWLWRSNRQSDPNLKRQTTKAAPKPLDMVRCSLCSLHVPAMDAVQGNKGVYCSDDHRHQAEP
jgi:uncharacterized protein